MKKFYYAVMMFPLLLSGCTTDQNESGLPAQAAMSFSNVAAAALTTRADVDFTGDFAFKMPSNSSYSTEVSSTASHSTGQWVIAGNPVYLNPASRELYAWYPVDLNVGADYTAALTTQTYADGKDVLYFYKDQVNSGAAEVNVLFHHAYARLSFVLAADETYNGAKILSVFTVNGLNAGATVSLKDGSLTSPTAVSPLKLTENGTETFPEKLSALVVPATTLENGITFDCTIDGQSYPGVQLTEVKELAAGSEYVVTLKIKGTEMGVSSVKVQDWVPVKTEINLN